MNIRNEVNGIMVSADLFIAGIRISNGTLVTKNMVDQSLILTKSGFEVYIKMGNQAKVIWSALRELYVKKSSFTSEYWHMGYHANILILDPDGWNRSDYDFSFKEERITHDEFLKRLAGSTVIAI